MPVPVRSLNHLYATILPSYIGPHLLPIVIPKYVMMKNVNVESNSTGSKSTGDRLKQGPV